MTAVRAGPRHPAGDAPTHPRRVPGADPVSDRARRRTQVVTAMVAALVASLVAPMSVPAAAACGWLAPSVRAGRAARRRRAAIADDLPDVIALLGLAVGAGFTVTRAVEAVARWGSGPLAEALAGVSLDVESGHRLADRLELLADRLGDDVRPLVVALVASDRYGAPIGPALERLAFEARAASRRRMEEAVRRVPVKLVFPLVLCILPAFALLTVAPLIASALGALRLRP